MTTSLIIGNIFSFLSSICVLISVAVQSKKKLIKWQTYNIVLYIFACIALNAYTALVSISIALIRNILAYKNRLTQHITFVLCVFITIIGFFVNNKGVIGIFPILAITSYTVLIYTTKNEQEMRYALVLNMLLWFIHNFFVMAYPSAVANIIICFCCIFI